MSATKAMRRVVALCTEQQLVQYEQRLEELVRSERNPLRRASLRKRLEIVRGEQQRRDTGCVSA